MQGLQVVPAVVAGDRELDDVVAVEVCRQLLLAAGAAPALRRRDSTLVGLAEGPHDVLARRKVAPLGDRAVAAKLEQDTLERLGLEVALARVLHDHVGKVTVV